MTDYLSDITFLRFPMVALSSLDAGLTVVIVFLTMSSVYIEKLQPTQLHLHHSGEDVR